MPKVLNTDLHFNDLNYETFFDNKFEDESYKFLSSNKLKSLQKHYFKSNNFIAVAQITIIFNQIKEKHRLKAINEEILIFILTYNLLLYDLRSLSYVQFINYCLLHSQPLFGLFVYKYYFLFYGTLRTKFNSFYNKRTKATQNIDILFIQNNSTFIYDSKTITVLFSGIFENGVEIISGSASRVMCVTSDSIKSISFTCIKINKAINTLKLSRGHGADGISSFLHKHSVPDIPLLLLKLFTLSMETGSYPYCWKTAYNIPRYKSGDKIDMNKYRPINITPVISRIMEIIISDELSNYFLAGKFINDTQHGLLKSRSCMTRHFDFFNLVYPLRNKGYLVLVLHLDISKAFDMVSYQLLIGKLASNGVQNPLLAWFDSFLGNRHQIVKINSVRSGVIKGSVLGPLLFLVFINDIYESFCVDLSFAEQILKQTSKSQRLVGYITRDLYNNESPILMYKVCVRPLPEYCTFILSSARIKDKLRLELVQRRFTLHPFWKRRLKVNLIFFFKLLNKLSFTSNHVIQYAETSHYDIRNSLALVKQTHSKSSLYMNYFTHKFSRLWNNLPQSIRMIKSLPLFVRCIDVYCSSENALNGLATASVSHSTSDILGTLNV
ncbi:hypothetical protein MS3_00005104 [Schistosoma haematobium]|uniref:Reverse transcriptase domain-containing protein n=1 Tax=Schistosoma haematobium TaxID=6185 RepID=A0A6A5DRC9_SCHHA|nr:hypothetical protein MS3_00005104 [Schistosoma haematobium]KAH9587323.1 hypothetical protein MS3_00005104 [Schistosoma haematobium]